MSPRAAWQLEVLGFKDVYDFVAGKAEWIAHGYATEGSGPHYPLVGEAARRDIVHEDVPGGRPLLEKVMEDGNAVRPSEPLAELRERCKRAISSLPRELLSLEGKQDPYPVRLSDRLQGLVDAMHGSSR